MPAPKGNQNAVGNTGGVGGPEKYRPTFAKQAAKACQAGFTDQEVADLFSVDVSQVYRWKLAHVEFAQALKIAKDDADDRVERSLYARAIGYEHDDIDIRVVDNRIVQTEIRKHYPPDTAAAFIWLKNRRRHDWRDRHDIAVKGTMNLVQLVAGTPEAEV